MMHDADLESDGHDQLPSVDEYKAEVGYRNSNSMSSRPDPIGIDSLSLASNTAPDEDEDEDEDEHEIHSKYGNAPSKGYTWKYLLCAFGSLAAIITMAVIIAKNNNKNDDTAEEWHRYSKHYQGIIDFLTRNNLSNLKGFQDTSSPQYLAAQWLAHGDKANLAVPISFASSHANTFIERYALAVVYYSLGGPQWTHQLNFLSEDHVCTWYEDFDVVNDEFDLFSGDFISLGIHGCKRVNDDLVPFSIFLRKY
jgi:hypothetical protein